jgi:hypothetical protein
MKKETKETSPKERIVVLEKGKSMEITPYFPCCAGSLVPIRAM